MEKRKIKWLRLLLCAILTLTALFSLFSVPIGAIINSSQGSPYNYTLTQRSTFPMTFGFMYASYPTSTAGNTYTFATQLGGYGQEWNMSHTGSDKVTYTWENGSGVSSERNAQLDYVFSSAAYPEEYDYTYLDTTTNNYNTYKRGYQEMTFAFYNHKDNGSSSYPNNDPGSYQGVTIKATDIVYNTAWLYNIDSNSDVIFNDDPEESMLPQYYLEMFPTEAMNQMMNRVVFEYTVNMSVMDEDGIVTDYTYSGTRDTDNPDDYDSWNKYHSFVPIYVLQEHAAGNDTIIITDFDFKSTFTYYVRNANGGWDLGNPYDVEEVPLMRMSRIRYPLYNTSGVTDLGTSTYDRVYKWFGMPDMEKYNSTRTSVAPEIEYEADYLGWLTTAVGGFMSFEIFPNFSIGGVLGVVVAFAVVMMFLKVFAGG